MRENGGQYTHAATWTTMAFALMGDTDRAWDLFTLPNPIHHSASPSQIATYRVEPYVIAADVYALAAHAGQGGWTWYTRSAGWMYRLLLETLLGIHLEGNQLRLAPRLPKTWTTFKIHYRYRQTPYHITLGRLPDGWTGTNQIVLDGQELAGETIPLLDDRRDHSVEVKCGSDTNGLRNSYGKLLPSGSPVTQTIVTGHNGLDGNVRLKNDA